MQRTLKRELLRELLKQPNNKKTNNLIIKWTKDPNQYLTNVDIQMENKHMKRFSSPYVIRGMLVKTRMRYQYMPTRITKLQTLTTLNVDENIEQQEISYIIVVGIQKWYKCFIRQFNGFL